MNQQHPVNNYNILQPVEGKEIELSELFSAIWKGKWVILLFTMLFAIGGVLFSLVQPNTYQSKVLLLPMKSQVWEGGGIEALGPKIQVNVSKAETLAVLQSRQFLDYFIEKHDLIVPLMASSQWIKETNTLVLNDELYDIEAQQWQLDDSNITLKPSALDTYQAFKKSIMVSDSKGLISITITHFSPVIAQQWLSLLVSDLNTWMKLEKLTELKIKLDDSKLKIESSTNKELKALLLQRIEVQHKKKILIEGQDDFVVKTIDPALVAEEKAGPKRALISILSVLFGCVFGAGIVLFRFILKKN